MEELGIAVRAKKDLNAVLEVLQSFDKIEQGASKIKSSFKDMSSEAKKAMQETSSTVGDFDKSFEGIRIPKPQTVIDKLDEPTKKIIQQIKKLSEEGSEDLQKIRKAFDELEKAGSKATKEQLKNFRQLIDEYKALAGQRIEPAQLFETAAAKQLRGRLEVGGLTPEQELPLRELQQQLQRGIISRTQRAEVDILTDRVSGLGAGDMQGADWTSRFRGIGKWIIGGSILGIAFQAIRQWAEIDKELMKVERRFGNIRDAVENFGKELGYTKRESIELSKIWGEIGNTFNRGEAAQYVGFARYRGIEPTQAMQLRLAGRYVQQGYAGSELAQFENFAQRMGMSHGRIEELINTYTRLAKIAADQTLGLTTGDIRGIQMFTRQLWANVPGEQQRGIGQWGLEFINRFNAGMAQPGSDAARAFLMRAYGFGMGTTLTQAMQRIEAGAFGRGNIEAMINRLYTETPGMGREERIMALKGLLPQLGIKDIRQLISVWENPEERKRVLEELQRREKDLSKDFESLGEAAVSAGENLKVKIEDLKFDAVQKSLGQLVKYLDNDVIESLTKFVTKMGNISNSLSLPNINIEALTPWAILSNILGLRNDLFSPESDKNLRKNPTKGGGGW